MGVSYANDLNCTITEIENTLFLEQNSVLTQMTGVLGEI
jgi:hypothetical protein